MVKVCHERWQNRPIRVDEPEATLYESNEPETDADVDKKENIHHVNRLIQRERAV